jgi:hypothetical protein
MILATYLKFLYHIKNIGIIKEGAKFVTMTPAGKQIIQIRKGGIWQFYSKYPNTSGDCEEYWM